jgi:dTDP-4-dehydrorhamnose reductase
LRAYKIDRAIIASAITGVSFCENNPEKTYAINVAGTLELARQLSAEGIKVYIFSSDYVFDGINGNYQEDSKKNPLNEYGRQKSLIEDTIRSVCNNNYCILRISKVFSIEKGSGTLLEEIAKKLLKNEKMLVATDQYFCPICINDLVIIVKKLVFSDAEGLINVCSPQSISRLTLVQEIARVFSTSLDCIQYISLDNINDNIKRPKDTSMICKILPNYYLHEFVKIDHWINKLKEEY